MHTPEMHSQLPKLSVKALVWPQPIETSGHAGADKQRNTCNKDAKLVSSAPGNENEGSSAFAALLGL